MAHKKRIGSLDFDDVKASIQSYLQDQSEFTDYNFEGSGISQLINVLAYNTHYNALNANFLVNEIFMDTAVKRSSVVSRAKELGYTPRSKRASKATLNVTFRNVTNDSEIESLNIPRGTRFSARIGDSIYSFATTTAKTVTRSVELGAYIYATQLDVYEGVLVQHTEIYNSVDTTISIPNKDIDTSTLRVEVKSDSLDWVEYVKPSSILNVSSTSKIYVLQEGFGGYEIYFGDNTVGVKPSDTSEVRMTYMVTSGPVANNAINFTLTSTIENATGASVTIISPTPSSGGQEQESIDSIKLNATNSFGSQNRAVVASDYASITLQNFPSVKDCLAWDGSDNVPPKFGKVVLCVQPAVGDVLSMVEKNSISSYLSTRSVANTKIDFVDPQYINLLINVTARYDVNSLNIGTYELEGIVKAAVNTYAKTAINKFGGKLRYSSLVKTIDDANYSIVSNLTTVKLLKSVVPNVFAKNNIRFTFTNELLKNTFRSTYFFVSDSSNRMYLKDNGSGSIHVVYDSGSQTTIYQSDVGRIYYSTGEVQIDNLEIVKLEGINVGFTVTPVNQDLLSMKNIILNLSTENINVEILPDYS